MGGTRTGLPIAPALEAAVPDRTRPLRTQRLDVTPVVQLGGTQFIALPDFAVTAQRTLLRPADYRRVALIVTNNDAATGVRFGDQGVTATQGVRLTAGSSLKLAARSDIYVISEGANVTLSIAEELL